MTTILLKARSHLNLSSPTESGDAYCTQGFTYPLAMEQTATAQPQQMPSFYRQYEPYYGYDREPQLETLRRRLQRNGNPIDFPALSAPFSRPYQPYPRQNGWQELR